MKDYIQSLFDESAMHGRSPLDVRSGCGCNHKLGSTAEIQAGMSQGNAGVSPALQVDIQQGPLTSPVSSGAPLGLLPGLPAADPNNAPYPIVGDANLDPCDNYNLYPCTTKFLTVPRHYGALPYICPRDLTPSQVDRIVISVHGGITFSDLDKSYSNHAAGMYAAVYASWLNNKPAGGKEVAVFAPVFQDLTWVPYTLWHPAIWYWRDSSWVGGCRPRQFAWRDLKSLFFKKDLVDAYGNNDADLIEKIQDYYGVALAYSQPGPSSYLMMDELVKAALKKYPAAKSVTIVGHSGGGSFVPRYAMMDRYITQYVHDWTGKPLRYIALNSGTYPYTISERKVPNPYRAFGADCQESLNLAAWREPQFGTAPPNNNCAEYDIWPYGVSDFPDMEHLAAGVPLEETVTYATARAQGVLPLNKLLKFNMTRQDLHIYQEVTDCKDWAHGSCRLLQQGANVLEIFDYFRESLTRDVTSFPEMVRAMAMQNRMKRVNSGAQHSPLAMMKVQEIRNLMFFLT